MTEKLEGAPFVIKTFQLVNDTSSDGYVSWSETKDSFIVWKPVEFAADILPKYFKHNNFCSFIRQLNTYGFHKVETKQWEFKHELFLCGKPELLGQIVRRKSKKRESEPQGSEHHDFHHPQEIQHPSLTNKVLSTPPSKPEFGQITPISSPATHNQLSPNSSSSLSSPPTGSDHQLPSNKYIRPSTYPSESDDIESADEVEKLRTMNSRLMEEVSRLNEKQELTQDTVRKILDELIESRKEQRTLEKRLAFLAQRLEQKTDNVVGPATPTNGGLLDHYNSNGYHAPVHNVAAMPSSNVRPKMEDSFLYSNSHNNGNLTSSNNNIATTSMRQPAYQQSQSQQSQQFTQEEINCLLAASVLEENGGQLTTDLSILELTQALDQDLGGASFMQRHQQQHNPSSYANYAPQSPQYNSTPQSPLQNPIFQFQNLQSPPASPLHSGNNS